MYIQNNTAIPRDWLVAEYLLDGSAVDTAWSNDWTATNVTFLPAERGYVEEVGSFNGSSSNVFVWPITLWTNFTLNFLVKYTDSSTLMMLFNEKSGQDLARIYLNNDWDVQMYFWQNTSNRISSSFTNPSIHDWEYHFLTINIDIVAMTTTVYLDWVSQTITYSNSWSAWSIVLNWFYLWADVDNTRRFFNWKIWLTRIYNRALSEQEINQQYQEWLKYIHWNKYSLPNLQQWLVLEISKPQV